MVEFQSSQQKIECLRKPDYIFDLLQIIYDQFPKIRVNDMKSGTNCANPEIRLFCFDLGLNELFPEFGSEETLDHLAKWSSSLGV